MEILPEIMILKNTGEFMDYFRESEVKCSIIGLKSGFDISINKYREVLRLFKSCEILHIHTFNPLIAICCILSRKKIVFTEHGNFGFGRQPRFTDYINNRLKKKFINYFVHFISFNSKFTLEYAKKKYKCNSTPQKVVYNGINLKSKFPDANINNSELQKELKNRFVVGTTSRFAGFKRIDRLITGFSLFQSKKDVVLLIVGDGILRDSLEQQVNKLGNANNIIFTGFQKNVRFFQNLMDVCVFPSESEPFGLVAIETLSLGKPTIVFNDGGGITEIVDQICKEDIVNSIENLSERLEFYYLNRRSITDLAQDRINYSTRYNISNMTKEFNIIYEQLIPCVE